MDSRKLQRSMYEAPGAGKPQRITMALLNGAWVMLAWWLLFGGGIERLGRWMGFGWQPGDLIRRAYIALALSIYYVRLLFTGFVFLKRGVSWSEVFTIVPWVLIIYLLLAIAGGTNTGTFGLWGGIGVALFLFGSWMNSYAEFARNLWKQRPENRGRLYTGGLFRWCRHPNYFGDLVSFSGLSLISGAWLTVLIPVLMLAGFVFVNVPALDAHLHTRYGAEFDKYAARTRKLIPFVY